MHTVPLYIPYFCFVQSDEKFLCENSLPVLTYTANILWHTLEVDENIITRKFLTQKFVNEINANYGNIIIAASK